MKRFLLVAVLTFIGIITFAQERIAVFPFEDLENVFKGNEALFFYHEFSNEFTNRSAGRFSVVPRQDVEKLINMEMAFQLSDLSSKAKTAEYERVLNGTQILTGQIGRVAGRLTITVSLYNYPELIRQPGGTTLRVASIEELFDKIPELVRNMQNEMAGVKVRTYNVGDIGPAGGYIFYDKGVISDGWRYLEAAPVNFPNAVQWGAYQQDVPGTSMAIGTGKRNTELIVNRLNQLGETGRAAQLCVQFEYGGYRDWFLPSKDELDLMYKNLKQKGLGGFGNNYYWSSSQDSNSDAWQQWFSDGYQYRYGKVNTCSVRAIRAF